MRALRCAAGGALPLELIPMSVIKCLECLTVLRTVLDHGTGARAGGDTFIYTKSSKIPGNADVSIVCTRT